MKSFITQIIAFIICAGIIIGLYTKNQALERDVSRITVNNKALERHILTFKDDSARLHTISVEQQKTIAELKHSEDKNTQELVKRISEYKIKLSDVVSAQSIRYQIKKDTVFVYTPGLDTTYNLSHNPQTQHTITIKGKTIEDKLHITNTQDVIMKAKKETIDPPKKFFLLRWFQKKHIVVSGEVVNSNKDIEVLDQTFIKTFK